MCIRNTVLAIVLFSFFVGCASTVVPVTKYNPEPQQNVFPFFTKGQPIAAVQIQDAFMLMALEPTRLGYIRLWVLYQNTSDEPYLLEPLKLASLTTTRISKHKSESCSAESPTKILKYISDEKAVLMIVQTIGGALQAMAVAPSTTSTHGYVNSGSSISSFSATTTVNDELEKRANVFSRTAEAMMNTAMWYDIYKRSVSNGLLRKNTVFPGQSVNGYIYFPFPSNLTSRTTWRSEAYKRYIRSMDYMHVVSINTATGIESIKFMPIEGE